MSNERESASDRASLWASWGMSVLNGLVGDYLRERQNGLAIDMAFYRQGRPLALARESLLQAHPRPTAKICVLVHGLGCNESIWAFRGAVSHEAVSYGTLLQAELGYTPFYIRYNTGLPVAENGESLATLLDQLLACYPAPVDEIVLIGHSMGGLVLHSACHYAALRQSAWARQVTSVFYLGTPHNGADLEKLGHAATTVLHAVPNPITKLVGDILNLRSQGVKDLRHGTLLRANQIDAPSAAKPPDQGSADPWLASARHYLIAGTLTDDPQHVAALLFGDGLVAVPRAHDQSPGNDRITPLPSEHVKVFPGIHHLRLAYDPEVYQQIKQWCQSV